MSVLACTIDRMGSSIPPGLRQTIAEQANVVSRQQLLRAGVSRNAITSNVRRGAWRQIHPGIYRTVAGDVTWEASRWAAVLYAGPGALLSHETAAEILGLINRRCPVIHVVVPASRRVRAPEGVALHYSSFDYPRWRPLRGIPPHTFYAETIIDLVAAADNLDDVVGWVSRGIARNMVSVKELKAAAKARRRFRWREQIGEVIDLVSGGAHFPLEFRYGRDVERAHGLPAATRQAKFAKRDGTSGFRDRYYEEYGLIVELDGTEFHPEEQRGWDRARDNEAAATTGATLRYGWADVYRTPCETAGQLYRALRKRGFQGTLKPCSAACRVFLVAPPPSPPAPAPSPPAPSLPAPAPSPSPPAPLLASAPAPLLASAPAPLLASPPAPSRVASENRAPAPR